MFKLHEDFVLSPAIPIRFACLAIISSFFGRGLAAGDAPQPAVPESVAAVEIALSSALGKATGWKGALRLSPTSGVGPEKVITLKDEPHILVNLPSGSTWELAAEIKGFWAAGKSISVGPSGTRTQEQLVLWPTTVVEGSLRLEDRAERMPERITTTLESPPGPASNGRPLTHGKTVCPVDSKGAFRCELPATKVDLALRAETFIPVYRWGLSLQPGKSMSLGVISFRKGASLKGWAVVEEGKLIPGKGFARLTPLLGPSGGAVPLAERLERTRLETEVLPDGFFQFGGVPPGSYRLELTHPGFAVARVFPVDVWLGAETSLKQPVSLKRPLHLVLTVTPPQDWLGSPWKAEVLKAADFSVGFEPQPAFNGNADANGRIEVSDQAPGSFWLKVSDSRGDPLLFERFEVTGAADAAREFEIRLVTVRGNLTLGRDPLSASLYFGGMRGAVSVKMETNEKGEFYGVLPREGTWAVDVESADGLVRAVVKPKVKADRLGRASVDIRIPDTRIFGKVVKEDGSAVPNSQVVLLADGDSIQVETSEDGAFDLRGAPSGLAQISARVSTREGLWSADLVTLALTESREVGPVELRVRRMKILTGTVLGAQGPVAGAGVVLQPFNPPLAFGNATRTSLDGGFQAEVPAGAETLIAVVSPPGYALKAFQLQADGIPVVLNVPREGGSLEFSLPYSPQEAQDKGLAYVIFQNGLPLPFQQLLPWARGHGQPYYGQTGKDFQVPNLAPGEYRVCIVPRDSLAAWGLTGWTQGADCAAGTLSAGSQLSVKVERGSRG